MIKSKWDSHNHQDTDSEYHEPLKVLIWTDQHGNSLKKENGEYTFQIKKGACVSLRAKTLKEAKQETWDIIKTKPDPGAVLDFITTSTEQLSNNWERIGGERLEYVLTCELSSMLIKFFNRINNRIDVK